jgi:hypothetical protein
MKKSKISTMTVAAMAALFAWAANASIIAFEAESGTISSFNGGIYQVFDDVNALGGKYVLADSGTTTTGKGQLDYSVTLAPGTYKLWMRFALTTDSSINDSLFIPPDKSNLQSGVADFAAATAAPNNLHNFVTGDRTYKWICLPTSNSATVGGHGDYTVVSGGGGAFNFSIRGREYGVMVDAFAFVTTDDAVQEIGTTGFTNAAGVEALDAAVLIPEPGSGMLLIAAAGVALLRRRMVRQN